MIKIKFIIFKGKKVLKNIYTKIVKKLEKLNKKVIAITLHCLITLHN